MSAITNTTSATSGPFAIVGLMNVSTVVAVTDTSVAMNRNFFREPSRSADSLNTCEDSAGVLRTGLAARRTDVRALGFYVGGNDRSEHGLQVSGGTAGRGVAHTDAREPVWLGVEDRDSEGKLPACRHRAPRVHGQIEQHLI